MRSPLDVLRAWLLKKIKARIIAEKLATMKLLTRKFPEVGHGDKCPVCGSATWIESVDVPVRAAPFMTTVCACGWNNRQQPQATVTTPTTEPPRA